MESQRLKKQREVAILETIGMPLADPANSTAPVLSVDERILAAAKLTTGENNPLRPDAATRKMANKILRGDVDALEEGRIQDLAVRDGMQLQIEALQEAIAAQNPALALLTTELQATKAVQQAEQVKLAANTLADQAQDAWLALVDAEGKETKALATQTKAEATANKAAITAAELKATAQQLQIEALTLAQQATEAKAVAAQSTGTAALAAAATAQSKADAAQTKADAADVKAQAAQVKADAAQAKADSATTKADAATTKADTAQATAATAATNAVTAITNAATAQSTATAAQVALDAFKARFREGTATTPPITIQVATPATSTVNFSPAFADSNYRVALGKMSNSLLALDLSVTNKTPSSFTLTLRNTGLASLAVAAGAVDYIILHA